MPEGQRVTNPTAPDRLAVRKTYKLFIGGAFPRSESGRTYDVHAPTADSWPTWRSPPARTPATPSSRPARRSTAGPAPPPTTGARCSTGSPRCSRAAATSSSTKSLRPKGFRRPPPARSSTPRSTAGSGTPAGPTRSRRWSARRTRSPARSSTSRSRSRPAWSRSSRRSESSLLGLVSVIAPAIAVGNTVVVLPAPTGHCRPSRWPRCWRPPTCRAVWSTC